MGEGPQSVSLQGCSGHGWQVMPEVEEVWGRQEAEVNLHSENIGNRDRKRQHGLLRDSLSLLSSRAGQETVLHPPPAGILPSCLSRLVKVVVLH